MHTRRGFTLTELLTIVVMIVLLVLVLAPAVHEQRQQAWRQASMNNLRSHSQAIFAYAAAERDAWVNPFAWNASGGDWGFVWTLSRNAYWDFTGRSSNMMYSMYAMTFLNNTVGGTFTSTSSLISPLDQPIFDRRRSIQASFPDGVFTLDSSYWLSPTVWVNPTRFNSSSLNATATYFTSNPADLRRNLLSDVPLPSSKVIVWERFDHSARLPASSLSLPTRTAFFNTDAASPLVFTADGNVFAQPIRAITRTRGGLGPSVDLWPMGLWGTPYGQTSSFLSGFWGITEQLETGDNGTGAYPAYFWATRNGIRGRDIAR